MRRLTYGYSADVDVFDTATWYATVAHFSDVNLYQVWQHGVGPGRFTDVSRLLLKRRDEVVAAAEVRLFMLPFVRRGIAYIRWGPLWRHGAVADPEHFRQAIRALRNEYVCRRGMILRMVPRLFLEEDRQCVDALADEGFSELGYGTAGRSLLIDVSSELDDLRKGFSPTWRRHLNKAERGGLTLTVGTGVELFDEFVPLYQEMLQRKRLRPTADIQKHRRIQAVLPEDLRMGVVLARQGSQPCAGAIYSAIGETALFVFGATSDSGMRSSGSYLVHWEVLRILKEKGARRYDLNGINPELNPGTYQFKKGLAGKQGRDVTYGCVCQVVEKSFVIRHGDYAAGVARASSWYPTNARRVMAPERSNPKSSSKTAS